ncbi:MAG: DNA polymerase IV [Candidatus Eremiobacteraeota bacterium]|nr:DNA polymerase IV [Candidatus Eremiobacteraeota bacterium]
MILHGDLDAFYAAVAQRDDVSLRDKPVAVAGSSRRAVVLTASYEARPYGIHSAMPLYQAKICCPQLVVVPPDFERYRLASHALFEILRRHANAVEGLSLDEAFCDLGDISFWQAETIAHDIKRELREVADLTISIGIASGKMLAKIASDDGKPDGLVCIARGTEAAYLRDKPLRRLWGIGPKTEARLLVRGLERIGQLAVLNDAVLHELFGRWGPQVRELARGIDHRPVSESDPVRSISSEETFEHDRLGFAVLLPFVRAQAQELADRLQQRGLRASTVGIKLKLADRRIVGRQTSLAQPTDDVRVLTAAAKFCLRRADTGQPVRLIGVRVASLATDAVRQIGLFS